MIENGIIVDQFKGVTFVDVYVIKDSRFMEIEHGVPLSVMYQLINRFKREYGLNTVIFNEYNEDEEHIATREVSA